MWRDWAQMLARQPRTKTGQGSRCKPGMLARGPQVNGLSRQTLEFMTSDLTSLEKSHFSFTMWLQYRLWRPDMGKYWNLSVRSQNSTPPILQTLRNEIISYHVSSSQGINLRRVSIKFPSQYGLNLNHGLQEDRQMTNDPSGPLPLQAGQDRKAQWGGEQALTSQRLN